MTLKRIRRQGSVSHKQENTNCLAYFEHEIQEEVARMAQSIIFVSSHADSNPLQHPFLNLPSFQMGTKQMRAQIINRMNKDKTRSVPMPKLLKIRIY